MNLAVLLGLPSAPTAGYTERISTTSGRNRLLMDDTMEVITGKSPEQIVTMKDARALRAAEREAAGMILDLIDAVDNKVPALSSGSFGDDEDNKDFAPVRQRAAELAGESAVVVHLTGDLTTLAKRAGIGGPRLAAVESPREIFYRHLSRREPLYAAVTEATVDTPGMNVPETIAQIARLIHFAP